MILQPKEKKQKNPQLHQHEEEIEDLRNNPELYIDWDNPWSLQFDYNFRYTSVPVLSNRRNKAGYYSDIAAYQEM